MASGGLQGADDRAFEGQGVLGMPQWGSLVTVPGRWMVDEPMTVAEAWSELFEAGFSMPSMAMVAEVVRVMADAGRQAETVCREPAGCFLQGTGTAGGGLSQSGDGEGAAMIAKDGESAVYGGRLRRRFENFAATGRDR